MVNELSVELTLWLSVVSALIYQCSLLNMDFKLKHNILGVGKRMSCKVLEMIFVRLVKVLFISPRDYIALAGTLSHCNEKSGLDVIQTPKSFSDGTTLSLELDPSSFM